MGKNKPDLRKAAAVIRVARKKAREEIARKAHRVKKKR
jgi:hypothetical protein